jgi:hypothetical protein
VKFRRKFELVEHGHSGMEEWWFALIAPQGAVTMQICSGKTCEGCEQHRLMRGSPTMSVPFTFAPTCSFFGLHLSFPVKPGQRRKDCSLCPGKGCFSGDIAIPEGVLFWETHGDPSLKNIQPETFWEALEALFTEMLVEAEEKRIR